MTQVQPNESLVAGAAVSVRPLRILIVDDDGVQLRAVQRNLRDRRVEITVADNAIDAMLQIGATKPDLVVLDVFMPGLDGIEACRRIKASPETKDVEVILASAAMTREVEVQARAAGAKRAIEKPLTIEALVELGPIAPLPVVDEPRSEPKKRGADLLVAMLAEAGVDTVFGLPGGAISPVHDALIDSNIRVITTRHEAGAMFAAAGYAHTTGKLGVVAVTSGPGALNAMTGLASAWCDGLPVLLLVGEVPRSAQGKGVLQDGSAHGLQLVEMMRHVSKLAVEVPRPSALPHLLRRAITTALSGRKGPVVMTLPLDVTTAPVARPRTGGSVTMGGMVATEILDEVGELIRGAARPLILAGSGCRGDGAPARLRRVAEQLRCPVATTPKAKGVFPEGHPLSLGVLGMGGHPSARNYLVAGPDVVVVIGSSLGDLSTEGFSPLLQGSTALVHVDIDARQIGRSYAPTHAVVASAADFLGGLADRFALARGSQSLALPMILRELPSGVERHKLPSSTKPDRIAPQDALYEIQELLPEDTIYTVDSGEHFLFAAHYLRTSFADQFLVMTGLGSMGQSIGAAIGAQLAHPNRSVAAICGDGCFAMNAFEIATAVAEKLPIRVFVFNDERLGMVNNGHTSVYGRNPDYSTGPLDVCAIARGLGAMSLQVDGIGQLRDATVTLRNVRGPIVVNVRIDHEIVLPKLDRVAVMAQERKPAPAAAPPPAALIPKRTQTQPLHIAQRRVVN